MQALLKTFKDLEMVETRLSEIYDRLSEHFRQDREAFNLFTHLKLDEISHQNILQYESRVLSANPDMAGEFSVDTGMMDRILEDLRRFRDRIPSPTLDEALRESLTFEKCAAELYYREAFEHPHPQFARFISALHAGCLEHYEKLWRFAASKGIIAPLPLKAAASERP
jgi:hypothetical protein